MCKEYNYKDKLECDLTKKLKCQTFLAQCIAKIREIAEKKQSKLLVPNNRKFIYKNAVCLFKFQFLVQNKKKSTSEVCLRSYKRFTFIC